MENYQSQIGDCITHFDEMEKKLTLHIKELLDQLKEKE